MAMRTCWECNTKSHLAPYGDAYIVPSTHNNQYQTVLCAFKCDNCSALSVGRALREKTTPNVVPLTRWIDFEQNIEWIPALAVGRDFDDVPTHIAESASEAYRCSSIGAHRAATLMARSVIEATAKHQGITSGNLATKIDEMHNKGLIREYIRDGAHEVRYFGNDMAHGDFTDPVSADDAELALTLMSEVLEEIYQAPARVTKARQTRAAKAASSP